MRRKLTENVQDKLLMASSLILSESRKKFPKVVLGTAR